MYPPQISIRIAVPIIYLCVQDCVTGNTKQVFVVAMCISVRKTEALTDSFNADFLGFLGFIFGKGFPKRFQQILPHK